MPLEYVECTEDDYDDDQRKEPFGVHDALSLIPVAVYDVTIEEERHILHDLYETRGVQPRVVLQSLASKGPPELFGQITSLIDAQRHDE